MAHISIPQNASGIQNSQNVTANEDTNKKIKSSLHPAYRGISVITPLPLGEGSGEASDPQKAFGIQRTQSDSAEDWVKIRKEENL